MTPHNEGAEIHEEQLIAVRLQILADNMRAGMAAALLVLPLLAAALAYGGGLDRPRFLAWAVAVVALVAVFYGLLLPRHRPWVAAGRARDWLRLQWGFHLLLGLTWGLAGALFFEPTVIRLTTLLVLALGMFVSCATATAVLLPLAYAFILPCALPFLLSCLAAGVELAHLFGMTALLIMLCALAYAHVFAKALTNSIRMRFENQRLNEALTEQRVRERTAVLEAASAHKSAFLATVSHEIRTPMNAIIGMSGLLLDSPLSAEQRDYAATIRDSGETLLTIINDILDFSKIEAGRMGIEQHPFELRDCIESALDLMAVRAAEKRLELAFEPETELPQTLLGDVTRLRQVLLNLLSNAVKFTESGEVVVSARLQAGELHFAVRDTGIGLTQEGRSRLFASFSQADSSTTRKYGGTGLGLAISKRLVELMGGRMWAESDGPGCGSCFRFTLPAVAGAAPQAPRREFIGTQPALKGRRMLVVDDNATNRRILALQAAKWGMTVRDTESPLEALQLALAESFDLVVVDMHMPHMDGLALARRLRDLKPELPRVLFTSLGRRDVEEGLFAAVMMKPLRQSQLFDTLVTVLHHDAAHVPEPSVAPRLDSQMAARHPLRVLLAEDNAVNQKLALRLLGQMGYRADVAADGVEAVECVQRQPYDLVLMDVQMPEMDGLAATRLIVERLGERRPRIVAMTANAMQGDREACLAAGMDDYLTKPIRVEALVQALQDTAPRS
ncbi:response regulator [Roseateles sp.]|uniref:response regulator n=1 Tax=Roseateles sp. TaxID=1971397 RepID=UPI0039EC7CB6